MHALTTPLTANVLSPCLRFAYCTHLEHIHQQRQQPYRALLQCLSEMSSDTKKRFLNFVLGCPTLPPGGLHALLPPLEISRKQGSAGAFASEEQVKKDLPFARTCTHTVSFCILLLFCYLA
jgi:HECT-domain (ubiquitin-transferase)